MKKLLFIFLFFPFVASAQVLLSDANLPAADTTHGAAAILTEGSITTQLPDGATATTSYLSIEPLRAYMVRTYDRLRLFRASDNTEIPLNDLIHFKPDEK